MKEESCPYNAILTFRYNNDQERDIFAEKIDNVTVFIFSTDGRFITSKVISKPELMENQSTSLDLISGDYHFVCWGNAGENTKFTNTADLLSARLQHPNMITRGNIPTNDHLYFGTCDLSIPDNDILSAEVCFSSAHINLEVYVKGTTGLPDVLPQVEVHNLKPQYDFTMSPLGDETTYYPVSVYDEERHVAATRLQTLRFDDDNPIIIEIKDPQGSGNNIARVDLKEFMAKNKIHVTGIQEATVEILLEFEKLGVTVTVPNWESEEITPEGPDYN